MSPASLAPDVSGAEEEMKTKNKGIKLPPIVSPTEWQVARRNGCAFRQSDWVWRYP